MWFCETIVKFWKVMRLNGWGSERLLWWWWLAQLAVKKISLCLAFRRETRPKVLARSAGLEGVQGFRWVSDESLGVRWLVVGDTSAFTKYLVRLVGSGPLMSCTVDRAVQWIWIFLSSGLTGGGIPRGASFCQPYSLTQFSKWKILLESEKSWHFLTFQLFQLGSMTSWLIFCKMFRIPFGLKNRKLQMNIIVHHSVGAFIKPW